jgi:hypothetical protein
MGCGMWDMRCEKKQEWITAHLRSHIALYTPIIPL